MGINNTAENYGTIAKFLHWATAVLFLGSYVTVYYRHWFTVKETPENWIALQLHLSVGVSIAVVVSLRVLWKLCQRIPDPEPGTRLEQQAAHAGHLLLYVIMIVMPITGYIGTGVHTEFFFLFDIPKFEDTPLFATLVGDGLMMTFKEFEAPVDFIHKNLGAWVVWVLILGHVLAALYHHFVRRDRTIYKMTTG